MSIVDQVEKEIYEYEKRHNKKPDFIILDRITFAKIVERIQMICNGPVKDLNFITLLGVRLIISNPLHPGMKFIRAVGV